MNNDWKERNGEQRRATFEEIDWCSALVSLINRMPKTMGVIAEGDTVQPVDNEDLQNYGNVNRFSPLMLPSDLRRICGIRAGVKWK